MLVLGLDTSGPAVSVGLVELEPGDPPHWGREATWQVVDGRAHGELLATGVAAVLVELGAAPADLGAVAVGLGPGPYTGLRVGVVTAAALADALRVPSYGVLSLDAVAVQGDGAGRRLVVTDARRREIYWAEYDEDDERVAGPAVLRPADLERALLDTGWQGVLVGEGAHLHAGAFPGREVLPDPLHPTGDAVVLLAARRALDGAPSEVLVPRYLRRPDAVPPGAAKPVTR